MASNPPPFEAEDSTCKDFFDKLVNDNDDLDFKDSTDTYEFEEAKTFANSSINEVDDKTDHHYNMDGSCSHNSVSDINTTVEDGGDTLLGLNSIEFNNMMDQTENEDGGVEVLSDRTFVSKSSGEDISDISVASKSSGESGAPGVKQVGWSAFNADSVANDGNGFGSYSDFFTELGGDDAGAFGNVVGGALNNGPNVANGNGHESAYIENSNNFGQYNEGYNYEITDQNSNVQHGYWENQYPGWKYDSSTGQWYQIDGYDVSVQNYVDSSVKSEWNQVSLHGGGYQNQISRDNDGYPPHVVFDPQYPGWYYDTIAQKWQTLESYSESVQSTVQVQDQVVHAPIDNVYQDDPKTYTIHGQVISYNAEGFGSNVQDQNWSGPVSASSVSQFENVSSSKAIPQYCANQNMEDHHGQNFSGAFTSPYYENAGKSQNEFSMPSCSLGFVGGNSRQQFNESTKSLNDHKNVLNNYYINQSPGGFSQQHIQSTQISYAPSAGRSLEDRPAHALVTFGFGGKLIVLKHHGSTDNFNVGHQNSVESSILVLSLAEFVNHNAGASSHGMGGVHNYFQALCQRGVLGPLSSGSVSSKEFNKWIDDRIANTESAEVDYRKAEALKLLLSMLKIACQYYGKLRSPYGTDAALKESDAPELAVARLFASAKRSSSHFSQYGAVSQCLHQMPSEGQMQVTAAGVQSLLVSGMKKEALECAQEGRMWGPALVLASQLGDQFYVESIKKMALCQFVAGSPLRTLCLLIANQPAEVFSADSTSLGSMDSAVNMTQQRAQFGANGMLDCWEENLAVITANRTNDDGLVLTHLGDCLWKDRSDISAAHICYLVAEANIEPFSDTSRMCLIGADHWRFPRTYASPEAIQRTEVYEYSKTLGNSQFVLLPFQPYKLIYAEMLAEVGRMSDALKYCQAVLKSLKTSRTPDTLRNQVLSLEDRIKAHQHGGFSTNLAPKRFVGKLLNLFDNTAQRVVGSTPPSIPASGGNENDKSSGPRITTSQSTMAMSSLVPPQSMGPINVGTDDGNRKSKHTRSVSEPDVGRSPRQGHADFSKEESSIEEKTSEARGKSRLGRFSFGSQLFQKTVGLVLKPRQDRQAKLGETNKFYYDEKLKRWVEEGSTLPAEEPALPPPPPTAAEHKSTGGLDNNSGIPPLPPTTNQFPVRARMGVRSRYVDTFNKGGGGVTTNVFQSPSVAPVKPANRNFFVPSPVEQSAADVRSTNENPLTMQKIASMNNISNYEGTTDNGSFLLQSRRTTSWSGEVVGNGMHPSPFGSTSTSTVHLSKNGEDLHQVQL